MAIKTPDRRSIALFLGGALFCSAGIKLLSSKDAKKVYANVTAAAIRAKDWTMETAEHIQSGAGDILADAKEINLKRGLGTVPSEEAIEL